MTAQAAPAEDDEGFEDVPTLANRANPTTSSGSDDGPPAEATPGIGSYRMVRPSTSDTIAPPPSRPRKGAVVIGVARKMP